MLGLCTPWAAPCGSTVFLSSPDVLLWSITVLSSSGADISLVSFHLEALRLNGQEGKKKEGKQEELYVLFDNINNNKTLSLINNCRAIKKKKD